jgi:hypothetical protein
MPNQKFLSHVLKSQLMEALKFQYSNVLVHQSQQPASHVLQHHVHQILVHLHHVLIAVHDQQQVVQSVPHLIAAHAQLLAAQNVKHLNVHVLMRHAVKNPHLKRLLLRSAKSQRLVQPSL